MLTGNQAFSAAGGVELRCRGATGGPGLWGRYPRVPLEARRPTVATSYPGEAGGGRAWSNRGRRPPALLLARFAVPSKRDIKLGTRGGAQGRGEGMRPGIGGGDLLYSSEGFEVRPR